MKWHSVKILEQSSTGIRAEAEIADDSLWFSGHFPNAPILPGVALLYMVFDVIVLSEKYQIEITGFRKVRFKQIVKPSDRIEITTVKSEEDNQTYTFHVACRGETVCSGTLLTRKTESDR